MNTIQNIALERFDSLPRSIQTAIVHSNWTEKAREICKKNKLSFDVGSVLENSILMVMVGVLNSDEILMELKEEGVSDEVAREVVSEIDAQIFAPIKNELVEVFNQFEGENIGQTEEDNSLDVLTGETHSDTSEQDRDKILQEIEDMDASVNINSEIVANTPEINAEKLTEATTDKPTEVVTPAIGKTVESKLDTKTIEQAPEGNPLEKKLSENVVVEPKIVKIDPYREQIE